MNETEESFSGVLANDSTKPWGLNWSKHERIKFKCESNTVGTVTRGNQNTLNFLIADVRQGLIKRSVAIDEGREIRLLEKGLESLSVSAKEAPSAEMHLEQALREITDISKRMRQNIDDAARARALRYQAPYEEELE
jgi:hypothetical protein